MVRRWTVATLVAALGLVGIAAPGVQAQDTASPYNHVPISQFFPQPQKRSLFKRFLTRLSLGVEEDKKKEEPKTTPLTEQQRKNVLNSLPGQATGTYKARAGR